MVLPAGAGLLIFDGLGQARLAGRTEKEQLQSLASEFESLLIHEMLKSMRGWLDRSWFGAGEEDEAGELMIEVAEQQLARALAAAGGLGLARLMTHELGPKPAPGAGRQAAR